jgi:hypothetical protein
MENHGGMISTGKIPNSTPELSGNSTSSHLLAKQENVAKEIMNSAYRITLSYS